jgi:hypothetical protein
MIMQALRSRHPGKPAGFNVKRILGKGDLWITESTISYQGRPAVEAVCLCYMMLL